jgi:hypothetical protein
MLEQRRKRMSHVTKTAINVEEVAMEDAEDAEEEEAPYATPRPEEQEFESVDVDVTLSASDHAAHEELVAASGAEGSAEDALNATLAGAMARLDFFHAARSAYDEQSKGAIKRDLGDSSRWSGSGFEHMSCTPQQAVIDLAATLAHRRLPPRPAIFHADKGAEGKVLRWQYFGYGAQFANAHSQAMAAMGYRGFNFTECRLGTTGLREVMPAITANLQQLTQLDLTSNELRDAGATILAHSLSGYDAIAGPGCRAVQNLRELILSSNGACAQVVLSSLHPCASDPPPPCHPPGIGDEGAKVLSENLFFIPSLAVLTLDNNLMYV